MLESLDMRISELPKKLQPPKHNEQLLPPYSSYSFFKHSCLVFSSNEKRKDFPSPLI